MKVRESLEEEKSSLVGKCICFTKESLNPNLCQYLENDPHPVVDVVDHLVVLAHHHLVLWQVSERQWYGDLGQKTPPKRNWTVGCQQLAWILWSNAHIPYKLVSGISMSQHKRKVLWENAFIPYVLQTLLQTLPLHLSGVVFHETRDQHVLGRQGPRLGIRFSYLDRTVWYWFGDDLYWICFDHPNRETTMLTSTSKG